MAWWDQLPQASPLDAALAAEGVTGPLAQLAQSVYMQESSGGRNTRTSNVGAVGGMQILPGTFAEVADEGWDINDPVLNARAGIRYLKKMQERGGGDPRMAAIGYYGGPGAIDAALRGEARSDPRNPHAPNTFEYADQVLGRTQQPGPVMAALDRASQVVIPSAQASGNWWESMPTVESSQPTQPNWWDAAPMADDQTAQQPQQRSFIGELGRQAALTARHGIEGVGQVAGMLSEPIRQGMNVGLRAAGLPQAAPFSETTAAAADALGLPKPENATERVAGDVAQLMAGSAGIMGGARALAQGTTGAAQAVFNTLAANPGQQLASAAGAGGAGGAARESGAGPVGQAVASLAGGIAAPVALSGAQRAAQSVSGRLSAMRPQEVLSRLQGSLREAGVDWERLPVRVQQQLQEEAGRALRSGRDLDPAALKRLADFQRIDGATPTRGMLTQDPGQITREQNLAKIQANTGAMGKRNLSQVQADNNAALVRALDNMGADSADDATAAGARAIEALQRRLGSRQARINDLYSLARDSQGRSFPLDGSAFTQRAGQLLDDNLVAGALPADVRNHLNRIAQGEVPFTVDYAEQLKTMMGRLQRNTSDGSARYALGLVRQALDDAPVLPLGRQTGAAGARAVNPANLAATQGVEVGEQAVQAFNRARGANRALMRQIERTPALKALYDGKLSPDDFIQKYVISSSAKSADVTRLGRMLAADPEAQQAVRTSLMQHLKNKALSGLPDDIGAAKFSPAQYSKALQQIGRSKLGAFFDASEIDQLYAIGRVGRMMTNQPIGSAVNNSNTAATLIGRALDSMGAFGRGIRIIGIGDQISAIQNALRQRTAQQVAPALAPMPAAQRGERLIPASIYSALFGGASAVPPGEN